MSGILRKDAAALAAICLLSCSGNASYANGANPSVSNSTYENPLSAEDLVRISDFGSSWPMKGEHIFSLSPDRKLVAVQVRTADPTVNRYSFRIDVIEVAPHGRVRTIDAGGDFNFQMVSGIGGEPVRTGYAAATPLIWSHDGKWVYFLKRSGAAAQVWRAAVNGAGSEAVSSEAEGVDEFSMLADNSHLVYSSRYPDPALNKALHSEARRGFRYDARFIPLFADSPRVVTSSVHVRTIDPSTRHVRDATAAEKIEFESQARTDKAGPTAVSDGGRKALISVASDGNRLGGNKVAVQDRGGNEKICASAFCAGASSLWWTKDGENVQFIRRDGWGDSETAIYEWKPGSLAPRRLFSTPDLLLDCQPANQHLLCAREQSTRPRHLVLLDADSGVVKVVYEPNQEFQRFSLGKVERLHWRNVFGIEAFGDLIYPVGYVPGRTYPLIVVQYISRGFLRGGVGDEFPIQVFANRGYAVLSVNRPDVTDLERNSDKSEVNELSFFRRFSDRRSVLSAIEIAVQNLIDRRIANPRKVGITGLSDGSSTVQFALVNSPLFSAASVSGCCWEPYQDALVGPAAAKAYHERGWPKLVDYNSDFWSHISLISNAAKVSTPLLIQQSDDEFRGAVASYMALRQAGRQVALYVFPDEYHVKWQPAHRLSAYERNLRWFDYWLRGIGDKGEWQSND